MTPEPERDVLGENLRRALGACQDDLCRSRSEFLRRVGGAGGPAAGRRPPAGLLTVAASLLVLAAIFLAILLSAAKEPARSPAAPVVPQEEKPIAPPKTPGPDELGLAEQIAFQETLLSKTTDEKERALVLATIKTLQGELARAQKAKPTVKGKPEAPADRAARLRMDLESVRDKLRIAKSPEDQARLQSKERLLAEELKLLEPAETALPKESDAKGAPKPESSRKEVPRPSPNPELQIPALEKRLAELRFAASNPELSEQERARARLEVLQVQGELDRLRASLPSERKK